MNFDEVLEIKDHFGKYTVAGRSLPFWDPIQSRERRSAYTVQARDQTSEVRRREDKFQY
jgi:hypothetical protein